MVEGELWKALHFVKMSKLKGLSEMLMWSLECPGSWLRVCHEEQETVLQMIKTMFLLRAKSLNLWLRETHVLILFEILPFGACLVL